MNSFGAEEVAAKPKIVVESDTIAVPGRVSAARGTIVMREENASPTAGLFIALKRISSAVELSSAAMDSSVAADSVVNLNVASKVNNAGTGAAAVDLSVDVGTVYPRAVRKVRDAGMDAVMD